VAFNSEEGRKNIQTHPFEYFFNDLSEENRQLYSQKTIDYIKKHGYIDNNNRSAKLFHHIPLVNDKTEYLNVALELLNNHELAQTILKEQSFIKDRQSDAISIFESKR
jgi:hypothetical protein